MTTATAVLDPRIEGYRLFLERRDGEPDLDREVLPARERFFERIERDPIRSRRAFSEDAFLRGVAGESAPDGDPHLLWLIATARANQAERFGVELGRLYGRSPARDGDPTGIHVVLQEDYHTRTLADVVNMFGLRVPRQPPDRSTRWLVHALVFNPFPERFALPLVGFSEMMGCVLFRLLRDKGLELFADEPEVADRIQLLFDEILADEICHVGLVEARLGHRARAWMHRAYGQLAFRAMQRMGPDIADLVGRERMRAALGEPFDQGALAAQFPGTAYAFSARRTGTEAEGDATARPS